MKGVGHLSDAVLSGKHPVLGTCMYVVYTVSIVVLLSSSRQIPGEYSIKASYVVSETLCTTSHSRPSTFEAVRSEMLIVS